MEGPAAAEEEGVHLDSGLLFLLCLVGAVEGADSSILPCTFFALQHDLGLTLNSLAVLNLVQALATNFAGPAWGTLCDYGILPGKVVVTQGCIFQGLGTIALACSSEFPHMLVLRVLNGITLASLRPVANSIVAARTDDSNRGTVFGKMNMYMSLGNVVGTVLGTNLARQHVWGFSGWRVALALLGSGTVIIGLLTGCLMEEEEKKKATGFSLRQELKMLRGYTRTPTFVLLVLQGCFGSVPWNALGYSTLFLQVSGVTDFQTSIVSISMQLACAAGGVGGGIIADWLAARFPLHGRLFSTQVSVLSGIPIVWCIFKGEPSHQWAFWYYLLLTVSLGLMATWVGGGTMLPMLSQLIQPEDRGRLIAWEGTLEGSCSSLFGNAMVGILAQDVFGYHLESPGTAQKQLAGDPESARALGAALALVSTTPWLVCFLLFSLMHWTYPRDLESAVLQDETLGLCRGVTE